MKGVEFLRKLYANAGFSIRPQARNGKVDLLKQMARTVEASSSAIIEAFEALAEAHRFYATQLERENNEIQAITQSLRGQDQRLAQRQLRNSRASGNSLLDWWAHPDSLEN